MPDLCSIDGCDSPRGKSRGWCSRHYQVWRRHGDPLAATRPYVKQAEACAVDECAALPMARGLCVKHYTRWKRHGTTDPRFRGQVVNGKRICAQCDRDLPVDQFRDCWCRDCWAEDNRQRQHVRRLAKLNPGGAVEKFTRAEVFERDGYICGICAGAIDPALRHPDPMSATVDHVIPLSRGGGHTLANAQAAHRSCNLRKWAHVSEEVA